MSLRTRSRSTIVIPLALVMLAVSSCASSTPSTAPPSGSADPLGETSSGARTEERSTSPGGESTGLDDVDSVAVARASTVPVRSGDTLGDLARAGDTRVPTSVDIERLEIAAPVVPAGIDADGAFDLPPGSEAGWYRFGPTPGEEEGSAVLAAHVDWNGVPGAFFDLGKSTAGDRLTVGYDDGTQASFEVVSITQYVKTELPLDDLFSRDGSSRLVLITCGGAFDRATRSYSDNVVVIAVPTVELGDSS